MKNTGENVVVVVEKEAEVQPENSSSGWWADVKNFFRTIWQKL